MIYRAYAGYRSDNGGLVETRLHELNNWPRTRHHVEGNVKVDPTNPFEVDINPQFAGITGELIEIKDDLTKALCVIIKAGLTPEQRSALDRYVPNLKILE